MNLKIANKILKPLLLVATSVFIIAVSFGSCKKDAEKSNAADILKFSLNEQIDSAKIDATSKTLGITVKYIADLKKLAPTIVISAGAIISPKSGDTVDFSSGSIDYTLTAEDKSVKIWKVSVSKAKEIDKKILSFTLDELFSPAVITDSTISIIVNEDAILSKLKPVISVSEGVTISPESNVITDFSKGSVKYILTASDGTTKVITVSASNKPYSQNSIISFVLTEQYSVADIKDNEVDVFVKTGTSLATLAPKIEVSKGATILPVSGATVDFSNSPVKYTVTAADGSIKEYSITVKVKLRTEKEISSFKLNKQFSDAIIADSTVTIQLYYSTDLTILAPEITISEGATIDPASGTIVSHKSGKLYYTVNAEDGSKKQWTVFLKLHAQIFGEMMSVAIPSHEGILTKGSKNAIFSTSGITDFSNLAPTFTLNDGTTSSPASGIPMDFSAGYAEYTLTSIDNAVTTYRLYIFGNMYEADNENIQYTGRIDYSDPKNPKFSASGAYIEAKFNGTSVDIQLTDENLWGNYLQYFQVSIDGQEPVRFRSIKSQSIYRVASGLSSGTHTIRITKDSEASIGIFTFSKIWCDELLTPDPKPARKIELYGNSITCGSGIYTDLCSGEWYQHISASLSYGPLVAKDLNAQYHITSWSGIGLTKSCCEMKDVMPGVYDRLYLQNSSSAKWDFSKYVPDVVTICLGQNDGVMDSATFVTAYVNFINTLKGKYPDAHFFCLTSPMSDNTLCNFTKKCLTGIENYYTGLGDNKVHKVYLTNNKNLGCGSHPNGDQHKTIATELEAAIKEKMGW